MSGSLESVRWNACEHRLDFGLDSHPKESRWPKEWVSAPRTGDPRIAHCLPQSSLVNNDNDNDDDNDDDDDDDDDDNNNNNNNSNAAAAADDNDNDNDHNDSEANDDDDNDNDNDNNNNRIQRRNSRFFLQSPHCAANCLQHVRSSCQDEIVCKSRAKSCASSAYHVQHVV